MSDYTKATDFAAKDALATGNPSKVVQGTEIDAEFEAIETAVATKADSTNPAISGGTIDNTTIGGTTAAAGTFTTVTSVSWSGLPDVAVGAGLSASGTMDADTMTLTFDTAWGDARYLQSNESITLSGDATGTGTTAITVTVVDDSHSHTSSTISGLAAGDTTSGTFADARISESSVTQHKAAVHTNAVFTGSIGEDVYALSGTTPALAPANGTIQTWTLSGNSTPTDSLANGESMTLKVLDGASYTITWPTMEWIGGSSPTLDTTNDNWITLWKVGGVLYGSFVGVSS